MLSSQLSGSKISLELLPHMLDSGTNFIILFADCIELDFQLYMHII